MNIRLPVAAWLVNIYSAKGLHVLLVQLFDVAMCAGVEALNLARWPVGGYQEQAVMSSVGCMWRLTQLDLADSLVTFC